MKPPIDLPQGYASWWDGYVDNPGGAAAELGGKVTGADGEVLEESEVVGLEPVDRTTMRLHYRSGGEVDKTCAVRTTIDASGPHVGAILQTAGIGNPVADLEWVGAANLQTSRNLTELGIGLSANEYAGDVRTSRKREFFRRAR